LHACTSSDLGFPGSGVSEILIVSPIPCCNKIQSAAALATNHFVEPPASVSHRWRGQSVFLLNFSVADITSCTSEDLIEITIIFFAKPYFCAFFIDKRQD
jgi:hypothetical protein